MRHIANFQRYYGGRFKAFMLWFTSIAIAITLIVIGIQAYANHITPKLDINRVENINNTQVTIKDANGDVMWQKINHPENAIKLSDMDPYIPKALLSIEDRHFYSEGGVNYGRTIKSAITDLIHRSYKEGGSTITQQLIKNTYFSTSQKDKTLKRKLMEFKLANELASKVSKKEILTWYLNKVFFGYNIYGVDAASKAYFGVSPKHLRITQSALLAGMIQSPTGYNPYTNPKAATNRRNTVLYTMAQEGYITYHNYITLSKVPLSKDIVPLEQKEKETESNNKASIVDSNAVNTIKSELKEQGIDIENNTQPITVESSIDTKNQKELINAVEDNTPSRFDKLQDAITVIDNKTGKVIAQNGGRNQVLNGFDRSTMNMRSTGSTIKPFIDYIPAFELLNYDENTIVNDSPYKYPNSNISLHDWDNKYQHDITVSDALAFSRNIPAVKILEAVGLSNAHRFMSSLGYTKKLYYADGIGINVPSIDLASYYATLANQGMFTKPSYINKITIGNKVVENKAKFERKISTQTSYAITKILKRVPQSDGFGNWAKLDGVTQAGKTGTISYPSEMGFPKNAISDSWYAGYTKRFTIVVWNGFDNPSDHSHYMINDDSKITEEIYKDTLRYLNKYYDVEDSNWSKPSGSSDIPLSHKKVSKINDNWFQKQF